MNFSSTGSGKYLMADYSMRGPVAEMDVSILLLHWLCNGAPRSQTERRTAILFQSRKLHVPNFSLRPNGWAERVASRLFHCRSLQFEGHPKFSSKYVLNGDATERIRTLFGGRLIAALETVKPLSIEGADDGMLMYRGNSVLPAARIERFLTECGSLAETLAHENRDSR